LYVARLPASDALAENERVCCVREDDSEAVDVRDVRNEERLGVNGFGCERRADEKVRSGVDREVVRV
jgi:hypothetical protein